MSDIVSNIDKAAEVIRVRLYDAGDSKPESIARMLSAANLLAPEPRVVEFDNARALERLKIRKELLDELAADFEHRRWNPRTYVETARWLREHVRATQREAVDNDTPEEETP